MSNRVKVLLHSPGGTWSGSIAYSKLQKEFLDNYLTAKIKRRAPAEFNTWPRWKRSLWYVEAIKHEYPLGGLHFKVFRTNRITNHRKTVYGSAYKEIFGGWPPHRKKPKPVAKKKLPVEAARTVRFVDDMLGTRHRVPAMTYHETLAREVREQEARHRIEMAETERERGF